MEQINFESYFYRLNIAGFENWSSEELLEQIEIAKDAMDRIKKDIYDSEMFEKLPDSRTVVG